MKQLIIDDLEKLPEILRAERIRQKKTQVEIAHAAYVSKNMIGYVETGKSIPGIAVLKNWARALGYKKIVIKC